MREIKFRAFVESYINCDGVTVNIKKVFPVNMIDFESEILSVSIPGVVSSFNHYYKFRDVKLMQYIGLTDENGKDIYDGDVTKLGALTGVIEWVPEDLSFFNVIGDVCFRLSDYHKGEIANFEVIGNIHENPGLVDYVSEADSFSVFQAKEAKDEGLLSAEESKSLLDDL